jgi:hypothetical protein
MYDREIRNYKDLREQTGEVGLSDADLHKISSCEALDIEKSREGFVSICRF